MSNGNIELKNGTMQFLSCSVPFPNDKGLHGVFSGCGQGKSTMILEIIKQKWKNGILVVVPTIEAADEFGKKIEAWSNGMVGSFVRCKFLVLHSGENRITEMQSYKSDPLGLKDYDVLVITSARIIIDPYDLFLSSRGNNGKRGLVLIDEMINFYPQPFTIPQEIKDIVTFVDHCKTHNGKAGVEVGNGWYRHHYQGTDAM